MRLIIVFTMALFLIACSKNECEDDAGVISWILKKSTTKSVLTLSDIALVSEGICEAQLTYTDSTGGAMSVPISYIIFDGKVAEVIGY